MFAYSLIWRVLFGAGLAFALLAAGQAEVLIETSPLGGVHLSFSDGVRADWSPAIMGTGWAYRNWEHAFLLKGSGESLLEGGQTSLIPVPRSEGKSLEVLAQLEFDENDPQLLHFSYRFTAADTTPVNSAYIELRLPAASYAGDPFEFSGGKQETPELAREPPQDLQHLANGTAQGVAIAPDSPHGFRIGLESPRWCLVNDERVWRRTNEFYTVQLCAVVAAEGTTLEAGATKDVAGTIRFSEPIRVADATAAELPAGRPIGPLTLDLEEAAFPRLLNGKGEAVARFGLWHSGRQKAMEPEPPFNVQPPAAPGGPTQVQARLWSDADHQTWVNVELSISGRPGELGLSWRLVPADAFPSWGLMTTVGLPKEHFEGCRAVFLSQDEPTVTLRQDPHSSFIGRAMAYGLRIQSADGPVLELLGEEETCWDLTGGQTGFLARQWIIGSPGSIPVNLEAGAAYEHTLTCCWQAE
jgi:hypothetical protein